MSYSCSEECIESDNVLDTHVIKGEISYSDILTEKVISDDATIKTKLEALEEPWLPINYQNEQIGNKFEFGALKGNGKYQLTFEKVGEVNYTSKIVIDNFQGNNVIDTAITLTISDETRILVTVLSNDGSPIKEAGVMLYNDSTFMKDYGENGGFIDSLQTNQFGKALFSSLKAGQYFLFPIFIVGSDTLRGDLSQITTYDIIADQLNEVSVSLVN
ncbi:hypothetical protein [Ekhidna sp.]|uniref:hypothetical protein n=1 Tax=Ekhidna sp. TaxID=2608089 RepID=UPI003CCC448D